MTLRERRRVWIWLAYWAGREADEEFYAYPRPEGWEERMDRACDARERFRDKLEELGGAPDEKEWVEAVDAFGRPNARG